MKTLKINPRVGVYLLDEFPTSGPEANIRLIRPIWPSMTWAGFDRLNLSISFHPAWAVRKVDFKE
jgi:hypothetical protein